MPLFSFASNCSARGFPFAHLLRAFRCSAYPFKISACLNLKHFYKIPQFAVYGLICANNQTIKERTPYISKTAQLYHILFARVNTPPDKKVKNFFRVLFGIAHARANGGNSAGHHPHPLPLSSPRYKIAHAHSAFFSFFMQNGQLSIYWRGGRLVLGLLGDVLCGWRLPCRIARKRREGA